MSKIYSSTNRIRFTDIPEKYAIPRQFRAKQSEVHSAIITYVFDHYKDTKKFRQLVVDALNRLTYCVMHNELPSFKWNSKDPINTMPDIDLQVVEEGITDFFLTPEAIEWVDLVPSSNSVDNAGLDNKEVDNSKPEFTSKSAINVKSSKVSTVPNKPLHKVKQNHRSETIARISPTPKEDLYIQPPHCARFDVNKVWMSANVGGDNLVIYTTIPEIPTCQNEISVTTELDMMTDDELMALYPNHVVRTRATELYEHYDGIDYDEDLGCIVPIEGFSKDQIVDSIIKYPHLYRLRKMMSDGSLQPFFSTIEIDGELKSTSEIWDSIPESSIIPRHPEFIKEYVIRRYLLEKENGMEHNYNIVGGLDPFLTLFMPFTKYIERGYKDTLSIVKLCVTSRVHYKQARNPILKRIENSV